MRRSDRRVISVILGGILASGALLVVGCSPQGSAAATTPGGALLQRRCSICHTLERIDKAQKDEAGWNATIDRMRGKGAVVTEQEQKALVEFLLSR